MDMKKRIHLELRNRTPSDVSRGGVSHLSVLFLCLSNGEHLVLMSRRRVSGGYKVSSKLEKMTDTPGHIVALRSCLQLLRVLRFKLLCSF